MQVVRCLISAKCNADGAAAIFSPIVFFRRIMNVSSYARRQAQGTAAPSLYFCRKRGYNRYCISWTATLLLFSLSCDFYYIPDTHVRCSLACALAPHAVTTGMTQTSRGKKYWGISLLCANIYTAEYDMPP